MKLAVIPARGGSKRLPRKNIRDFFGKPAIAHVIEMLQRSQLFDHIVVSTEDLEIAGIAKEYGAEVPFLRSQALARDEVRANDVLIDTILWFKENKHIDFDLVCCVYPTALLLKEKYLKKALQSLLSQPNKQYAFATIESDSPVQRAFFIDDNQEIEMFFPDKYAHQSQELAKSYYDAGLFYWGKPEAFLTDAPIFSALSIPIVVPRMFSQDINTLEDWEMAQLKYRWSCQQQETPFKIDHIVLGTVQFGLPYGITNVNGTQVSEEDGLNILNYAAINELSTLDTASAYGESEQILGKLLHSSPPFNLITKLHPIAVEKNINVTEDTFVIHNSDIEFIKRKFDESCSKLRKDKLYGVMVHSALDLLASGGEKVYAFLESLKAEGRVEKIGCSFYCPERLFTIMKRFDLDLVQVPLNLFDQRFITTGAIEYLQNKNVEIYARSVFLQGILLSSPFSLPKAMHYILPYINKLDETSKKYRLTRLELILHFLKKQKELYYVIGFNSLKEMIEVIETAKKLEEYKATDIDFASLAVSDLKVINPTLWPLEDKS